MTEFDYHGFKRETLAVTAAIGQALQGTRPPTGIEWLTRPQVERLKGKNFVTTERWQFRLLAKGAILVEISYGWMMDGPLLGLTVFHKGADSVWDHERSKACHSIAELVDALETLNAGRESDGA